jgi:hypothetical protein
MNRFTFGPSGGYPVPVQLSHRLWQLSNIEQISKVFLNRLLHKSGTNVQIDIFKLSLMDFRNEIAALREERQREIGALNFDAAHAIELHIEVLRSTSRTLTSQVQTLSTKAKFDFECRQVVGDFMLKSSALTRSLYQVRARQTSEVARYRVSQASEVAALSSSLAKDLELCLTRSIPQVNVLLRDAQGHAADSAYDLANSIVAEAERVRTAAVQERQAIIHAQYDVRFARLIAKHGAVEETFQTRLAFEIQQVHLAYRKTLGFHKARIATLALKYGFQLSETDVNALFEPYALRDQLAPPQATSPKLRGRVSSELISTEVQSQKSTDEPTQSMPSGDNSM